MQREIDLDGGEVLMLKTLGTSGTPMTGKMLVKQTGEMHESEFVDTLTGLIDRGYVLSNKVNILKMEDVPNAFFRTNPSYSKDLRNAMRPGGARKEEKKERRRRRG